ncbi:MAG: hypothetical protein ACLGIM_06265 [Alphaproteobacteria bacterium]
MTAEPNPDAFASGLSAQPDLDLAAPADFDDEDFDEDFLGEDEWEDLYGFQHAKAKLPENWHLIKVENFQGQTLAEMDEWLSENCRWEYRRVGWSSGCAYTVAVGFEHHRDAVHFRLRW